MPALRGLRAEVYAARPRRAAPLPSLPGREKSSGRQHQSQRLGLRHRHLLRDQRHSSEAGALASCIDLDQVGPGLGKNEAEAAVGGGGGAAPDATSALPSGERDSL